MLKFITQHDQMDCGPACLSMIASTYGKHYPLQYLRDNSYITREGVSLSGINEAARPIGFETSAAKLSTEKLVEHFPSPCILHWNQNHFVVLYKIKKKYFSGQYVFKIADPGHGIINLNEEDFKKAWLNDDQMGIALFLNPTDKFYELDPPKKDKLNFAYLLGFLTPYKKEIF